MKTSEMLETPKFYLLTLVPPIFFLKILSAFKVCYDIIKCTSE